MACSAFHQEVSTEDGEEDSESGDGVSPKEVRTSSITNYKLQGVT